MVSETISSIKLLHLTVLGGYIFKHDNDNNDPGDDVFSTRLSSLLMILVYPKDPTVEQTSFIKE